MIRILFVCLGNICRSVAAEGILCAMAEKAGRAHEFEIDSAGLIDYHEGELADPRMRAAASRRGYNLTHHSRPVTQADFTHFHYIIGMDADNLRRLRRMQPQNSTAEILPASDFFTTQGATSCVPDPYYGSTQAFEFCLTHLEDVCKNILEKF